MAVVVKRVCVEIIKCVDCLYYRCVQTEPCGGYQDHCRLKKKDIENPFKIPEWCPLESVGVKEEEEHE